MVNPFKVIKNIRKLKRYLSKASSTPHEVTEKEIKEIYDLGRQYGIKTDAVKEMIDGLKKIDSDSILSDDKGCVEYEEKKEHNSQT